MKDVKIKIALVLLLLFPISFSCKDRGECPDGLIVQPYFIMKNMTFQYIDLYWINQKSGDLMFDLADNDYDNTVYPCDSLAMYFECPEGELLFHSQKNHLTNFSFASNAFATVCKHNGWSGTHELVDKIYISSNYDFDETHKKNDNLSDIVKILAYTNNSSESWKWLEEYNENSPYEAPKRFYLLMTRKPTFSSVQQFVIKYYFANEEGEQSKQFIITTPVFHVQ